uniref:Transposase n=1 Tax=Mesocestoides corti TaxID=53468 RepID=A0A5K3FZ59_MESCO
YTRTGFTDQSQARTTREVEFIRAHHAGCAAHYIPLLMHVCLWLAAYHPRMPLKRRETQDWLRPNGEICLRPDPSSLDATVEYPSPSR